MDRGSEYHLAPPHSAPGVTSMVGYRTLDVPETVHRGMPSAMLTFIVSLDDGVEAGDSADALAVARPNPLLLSGLHVQASHVRQRRGQAGVQLAVHPLASRALFGVPSAELPCRRVRRDRRAGSRRPRVARSRDRGARLAGRVRLGGPLPHRGAAAPRERERASRGRACLAPAGAQPGPDTGGRGGGDGRRDHPAPDDAVRPGGRPLAQDGGDADALPARDGAHRRVGAPVRTRRLAGSRPPPGTATRRT